MDNLDIKNEKVKMVIEDLKTLCHTNRRIKSAIVYGSSLYKEDPRDLDCLFILSKDRSLDKMTLMKKWAIYELPVMLDACYLLDCEAEQEMQRDYLVFDVIKNGIVIYDDGTAKKLRETKVDLSKTYEQMVKKRLENIEKLKQYILENLSVIYYAKAYDYFYKKDGEVYPLPKMNELLIKEGKKDFVELGEKIRNARKEISFEEMAKLEREIFEAIGWKEKNV